MNRQSLIALAMTFASPALTHAADNGDLQQIRKEIEQLRHSYESHIQELEVRLKKAELAAASAQTTAVEAKEKVVQTTSAPLAPSATPKAGSNAFNPDVSLVLSGIYSNLSKDPKGYRIANFIPGGDIGPGKRGFSLSESELGISANIDPWFYGGLNFSIHPDDSVSAEEAFIQTTALPYGMKVKAGRFFSGIGYLNEQHSHTWDFVDAPLAYQAFLGSQFNQDGVQFKWLAPTDTFLELGAELGSGASFPGSERNSNGAGAVAVMAHTGGDIGFSNSWRAGVSWLRTNPQDRRNDDSNLAGNTVTNSFTGSSHLWLADFVWKWAPNGNAERTNFKLQGEYFHRREDGSLIYDVNSTASPGNYLATQSGWYLQGVYQFMPTWRVGLRYDQLDSGHVDFGANSSQLATTKFDPNKASLMFDWTPSEFSRIRLQFANDKSSDGAADRQIFLQYQMSLGAHGAHIF
ncbi:Carbohydrate porin [Gammaproteobacteria bacterium]